MTDYCQQSDRDSSQLSNCLTSANCCADCADTVTAPVCVTTHRGSFINSTIHLRHGRGHVARMEDRRGEYRVLVGKLEGKRPLGRPKRRWENNIKYVQSVSFLLRALSPRSSTIMAAIKYKSKT